MLWIYLSKNIDSLALKMEEFLYSYGDKKMIHSSGSNFERVKNELTQVSLFGEVTHFLFEDYSGSFTDIDNLFSEINIEATVLITKLPDRNVVLPWSLIEKLEDSNYLLYKASMKSSAKYLELVLKSEGVIFPTNFLELMKKEGLNSSVQMSGMVEQLKLLKQDSNFELSEELLKELMVSNNVLETLDEKWSFLEWYCTGKIKEWYLFLKKVESSNNFIQEFLRSFCSSLNYNMENISHHAETLLTMSELGYNFFIFMESQMFKIKKDSFALVTYFFWKNSPMSPLLWIQ